MKANRFLLSSTLSKCCGYKAILVKSREGGFVSQDCLKCGTSHHVRKSELPELECEYCDTVLEKKQHQGKGYTYRCDNCDQEWHLASNLPHWSELFEYSGLSADGDI